MIVPDRVTDSGGGSDSPRAAASLEDLDRLDVLVDESGLGRHQRALLPRVTRSWRREITIVMRKKTVALAIW